MASSRQVAQADKENIAWSIARKLGMVVVLVLVFIVSATVTVFLLIRTGDTRVPKEIIDRPETEAQQIVQKAGLRVNVVRLNDDHPANTVFRTDPPPGA